MAIQVEIEGTSPNTVLDVGDRRVVTRTPFINNMVRGGFVKIVALVPATPSEVVAPDKSARKAEWAEFLTKQGVKFQADDTKARLMERWDYANRVPSDDEPIVADVAESVLTEPEA